MLLQTPSIELRNTQNNPTLFSQYDNIIKCYVHLRYSQEKELKEYKDTHKIKVNNINQNLKEVGVSPRRIKDSIKLVKNDINSVQLLTTEFGSAVFDTSMGSIWQQSQISNYSCNKNLIIESVQQIVELDNELKEFKEKQSFLLTQYANQIKNEGLAMYLITTQYQIFKAAMKIFETEGQSNLEKFRNQQFRDVTRDLDIMFTEVFEEIITSEEVPELSEFEKIRNTLEATNV